LKSLRNRFERFCYRNRNKGIPNLMLYLSVGSAVVLLFSLFSQNFILYNILSFDRELILQGQVWRLITYPLTYYAGNIVFTLIGLVCYYSLGRAMENLWGTCRFNLFYLCGILLQDVFCMLVGGQADVLHLNLSLFLAYATLYPNAQFLLLYIIPVKAWIFALIDLALMLYDVITMTMAGYFPYSLFPFVALLNYFLFFGKDVVNVFPISWRANFSRLFKKKKKYAPGSAKTIPFPSAGSYQATISKPKAPYNHRCTICGQTDISAPELEFRYCSRCNGYYCYCENHISNHTHIQ
jgi:membrane associated rhomboid family serine protease